MLPRLVAHSAILNSWSFILGLIIAQTGSLLAELIRAKGRLWTLTGRRRAGVHRLVMCTTLARVALAVTILEPILCIW